MGVHTRGDVRERIRALHDGDGRNGSLRNDPLFWGLPGAGFPKKKTRWIFPKTKGGKENPRPDADDDKKKTKALCRNLLVYGRKKRGDR